jgi:hypothetical protein
LGYSFWFCSLFLFWLGVLVFGFVLVSFWEYQSFYFFLYFPLLFFEFFFFLHVAKLSSSESLHAFSSERDPCRDQLVDEVVSLASQKIEYWYSSILQEARSILLRQDGQC